VTNLLAVAVPGLIETDADEVLPLASVGKLVLLAEIARALADGRIDPREELTVDPEDYCGGSGLLTALSPRRWTILDLVRLTASVSDNTATNALIRRIGLDHVNDGAQELGLVRTRVLDRIREPRLLSHPPTFALGTAGELAALAARLAGPEPWARTMLGWLALNTDRSMVAATIPHNPEERDLSERDAHADDRREARDAPGVRHVHRVLRVGNKTGTDTGIRADVGVVRGDRMLCYAAVGACAPGEEHKLVSGMRAVGVLITQHLSAPVPV
jgi:beta-lactamase class A